MQDAALFRLPLSSSNSYPLSEVHVSLQGSPSRPGQLDNGFCWLQPNPVPALGHSCIKREFLAGWALFGCVGHHRHNERTEQLETPIAVSRGVSLNRWFGPSMDKSRKSKTAVSPAPSMGVICVSWPTPLDSVAPLHVISFLLLPSTGGLLSGPVN